MGWIIAVTGGAASVGALPYITGKMLSPRIKAEQAESTRLREAFAGYRDANPVSDPHATTATQAAFIRELEDELHRLRAREEALRMRCTPHPAYHAEVDILAPSQGAGGDIIGDLYDE